MGVPFIKLFEFWGKYYAFDVNTDEIINISKKLYFYLGKLLKNHDGDINFDDEDTRREYESYNAYGYFSDIKVREIKHPSTDLIEGYLNRKINMMTLQVTQNCNLRCSYCVYSDFYNSGQRTHTGKRMAIETALKAVDFLAEHSLDSEFVSITFYGGEPLLEMNLVKKVVEYAEKVFKGKELRFSVTTNATKLDEEIVEYLVKKDFVLMISLDGPKEIHNTNRRFAADGKGSYDIIVSNLRKIKEKFPDYFRKISISMVIDPQNDFDEINSVFDKESVFSELNVHATVIDDIYSLEKVSYSEEYIAKREYHSFLAYLAELDRINIGEISPIAYEEISDMKSKSKMKGKVKKLSYTDAPGGPCIPGQTRLFVDVDGNLFPCERVSESSPAMIIGNLKEGFFYENARKILNIGALTADECKNCWAFRRCNLCARNADDGSKLSREKKLTYCSGVRERTLYELKREVLFYEAKCHKERNGYGKCSDLSV